MTSLKLHVKERVFVTDPPMGLYAKILKDNAFANPKYAENKKHGYSNFKTPQILEIYKCQKDGVSVPRGYIGQLLDICEEDSLETSIEDFRTTNPKDFPPLNIELRSYQKRAVEEALKSDEGVIISPTGSGKTLMGLEVIRTRGQKALIIVHRSDLAKQWVEVIQERLGVKAGLIGDGCFEIGDLITVAMIQTLKSREEETKKLSESIGLVLVDECHHVPSESASEILSWMSAKYLYGLSATPNRRDGLEAMIYRCIGPVLSVVERSEVEALGSTVPATVFSLKTRFDPGAVSSWNEYLDAITNDIKRNKLIADIAIQEQQNGAVLILCDRIEHVEKISQILTDMKEGHTLAHGQLNSSDRAIAMEALNTASITVGTTGLLGEGLDVSSWAILIMASPISSEIKLMQAIGRVIRSATDKLEGIIYDLQDDCGFSGSSFKNRFAIYKKHNILVNF